MARMLQALKNLEAKEVRTQNTPAPSPPRKSPAAVTVAATATPAARSGPAPIAPRIIEVVDKLDAVVGHELSGIGSHSPALAPSLSAEVAFTDSAFFGQPKTGAAAFPPTTGPTRAPASRPMPVASAVKAPSELERQVNRTLSDSLRCQPLVDLVDRLIRHMEQSESKVLAFANLGNADGSHLPILHAATLLAEKRAKNVLLIDGDVARRFLSDGLQYGSFPGLGEVLAGKAQIQASCQPTATKHLSFVPAGQIPPAANAAAAEALEKSLDQLKRGFDLVLIDAGNALSDVSSALAQVSDATYLVIELGAVETNSAQAALARLRAAGARVLGCIAT